MPNEVTITISFDSATDGRGVIGGSGDTSPSPLSIDALGAPGDTSGRGDAQTSSQAPTPQPLEQLRLDSSREDSAAPAPSPLSIDALGAPGDTSGRGDAQTSSQAPTPLPLEQLRLDFSREDSAAPAPSPLEAPSSADDGVSPSPMPLDELRRRAIPGGPPVP